MPRADKGLDSWFHPSGRVVLVGDSCHPMLPYLAAGSNSAMEDGVVLGECLKRVSRCGLGKILPLRPTDLYTRLGEDEREHPSSS